MGLAARDDGREVPQRAIAVGTAGYRDPCELGLPALIAMPFGTQRSAWLPPERPPVAATRPDASAEHLDTAAPGAGRGSAW